MTIDEYEEELREYKQALQEERLYSEGLEETIADLEDVLNVMNLRVETLYNQMRLLRAPAKPDGFMGSDLL